MGAPSETFIELFKRQPSESDKIRLMSVQKALALPDDDPLWMIMLALDYYHKLYEEAPAKILEATQQAASITIAAAEASTTEKLVNGALLKVQERLGQIQSLQWPWLIICTLLSIALIGLSISFWFATQQFYIQETALIASHEHDLAFAKEQLNKTLEMKIAEVKSEYATKLTEDQAILDWIKQYKDQYASKEFQTRIDFVAQNPIFVDAIKALEAPQRDGIVRIVTKADQWRTAYEATQHPWPCFAMKPRSKPKSIICQVGFEGEPKTTTAQANP